MQFEYPMALLLLLALPVVVMVNRRSRSEAVTFPGILNFQPASEGMRLRALRYLPWLRVASLAMLVFAIANPKMPPSSARRVSQGIAIEIVVDRSASMSTPDMLYDGVLMPRIEAVKRISTEFVFGDKHSLAGRPGDLIGLIGFAAYPTVLCPLTLSHDALRSSIEKLQTATTLAEDGTAIGDAVALATARLHSMQAASSTPKLIVLITDGENNLGGSTPRQAAQLAKDWNVAIYPISIRPDGRDGKYELEISDQMEALAGATHGVARVARDSSSLRTIYEEIDRMGRVELDQAQGSDPNRLFLLILLAALFPMTLEFVLRETWLRKVPA